MRVTLLGTGCPIADVQRYGPAALVEAGPETWLVDCGSGVSQRLLAHGTNSAKLTGLILTHLHSDHTVDFLQVLMSGWHQGRAAPLRVWGPQRTRRFFGDLLAAWQPEFEQRIAHELREPRGLEVEIEEIDGRWHLETEHVRISNTEVRHQPIPQAFGFRFDADGASAVISGDTAYSPELIELAQGCQLLVHEAFVHWQFHEFRRNLPEERRMAIQGYHTPTDQVGRVAAEAGAGALALTHFVPVTFDRERLAREVRADFAGPLFLGEDLMSFEVSGAATTQVRSGVLGHP